LYALHAEARYSISLESKLLKSRQNDMEKINKDLQEKIQQLQILEQSLQQILMQKQAFQFELNETESALVEVKKTGDEVFKMVGQIMLKANKEDVEKELSQRKDILSLRVKAIEKQENSLKEDSEKLRAEVMKDIK
jgi:prefoldin beta subunit